MNTERDKFNEEKSKKIAMIKAQIDQVESGLLLESLYIQLQIAESMTFQDFDSEQENRFICNC